jgi:putative membrane protein
LIQQEEAVKKITLLYYMVGLAGLLMPAVHHLFCQLTPLTLLLTAFLLALFHSDKVTWKAVAVFGVIYMAGFLIEVTGVQSGSIFGEYRYKDCLGFKLFDTPLIIGLNWLILVYISSSVFEKYKIAVYWKVVLAALVMLLYDMVLEIAAPKMGLWEWEDGEVPFRNYVAWFVLSMVFHGMIKFFEIKTENKLSRTVLLAQFVFFLVLALFL